jgi:hypothetical protein
MKRLTYSVVRNSAYKIRVLYTRALSLTADIRMHSLSHIDGPLYMPLSAQHLAFHSSARIPTRNGGVCHFQQNEIICGQFTHDV